MMQEEIVIKIRGGLGNQLFQYGYAKKLNKLYPEKKIVIDFSYFNKKHIRSLELDQMNISDKVQWRNQGNFFFDKAYDCYRLISRVKGNEKDSSKIIQMGTNLYVFCTKVCHCDFTKYKFCNLYLAGYFQEEKALRSIKNDLLQELVPKELSNNAKNIYDKICSNHSIGISIRTGSDYKKYGWPVCSKFFYQRGLDMLYSGSEKIFIFADEIRTVINEGWFDGFDVTFIEDCNAIESMYLLSNCNDYVISNSTFSWWGAYMSDVKNKRIIGPQYFYPEVEMRNSKLHFRGIIYLDNFTGDKL